MESKTKSEKSHLALTALAAGELLGLKAVLLRRQIAKNPQLKREYEEINTLWADLKQLQAEPIHNKINLAWSGQNNPKKYQKETKKMILPRRNFAIAGVVLTLTSAGGFAAKQFLQPIYYNAMYVDKNGHTWSFKSDLSSNAIILDTKGKELWTATTTDSSVPYSDKTEVNVLGKNNVFHGFGFFEVKDQKDQIIGSIKITPLAQKDKKRLEDSYHKVEQRQIQAYNPGILPPADFQSGVWQYIGGAVVNQTKMGLAWKLIGYGRVSAKYQRDGKTSIDNIVSLDMFENELEKPQKLPEKTVARLAPAKDAEPILVWSMGAKDASGKYAIKDGQWVNLENSGVVKGYGKHEIRDNQGKVVMIFDISSPIVPPKPDVLTDLSPHEREQGIQERLHLSLGSEDGGDDTHGYFGEGKDKLDWTLRGDAVVRFTHNGKLVRRDISRASASQERSPVFTWTQSGVTKTQKGQGICSMILPGGIPLQVEVVPTNP